MRFQPLLLALAPLLLAVPALGQEEVEEAADPNATETPAQAEPAPAPEPEEEQDAEAEVDPEAEPEPEPSKPAGSGRKLPGDDVDENEPEPPLIPAARDTLGGHLQLSPSVGFAVPFGELDSGASQADILAPGWTVGADVAFGVSRSVMLGAWFQLAKPGEGDDCDGCSSSSVAGGALLRYHLVQGLRFDPWLSAGVGYRRTSIDGAGGDATYSGLEFLRLQVGGDWYPWSSIGFGPFIELNSGVYLDRPNDDRDPGVYFQFGSGLRVTLDVPGK